jgi:hypothetical protein
LNDIDKVRQENYLLSLKTDEERATEKLKIDYENAQNEIKRKVGDEVLKNELLYELHKKFLLESAKLDDDQKAKKIENDKILNDANIKALEDAQALADENYIYFLKTEQEKETARSNFAYQKQVAEIEALKISEFEKTSLLQQLAVKHQNDLTEIDKKGTKERLKNTEAEKEAKITAYTEIGNLVGQLSDLVGKQTAVGKALALSQIAIDTALAVSSLTKNSESNPANSVTGGLAGAVQFATGIIRILANIKKAKDLLSQAKTPSGGGGGSSLSLPSTSSVSAPLQPQLATTNLNQSQINQLSSATNRAFVLESDVSGNQERITRLNRASRIN